MTNPKSKIQNPQWSIFPVRLLVYLVLIGLALMAEVRLVLNLGFRKVLLENAVVEWVSVGLCALTVLVFVLVVVADRQRRGLAVVLAILAGAACVREMDFLLTSCLSESVYHLLFGLVLLIALVLAVVRRRSILQEGKSLLERPSFVLLLFGFAMVTFWAQVLGQRELWGYFTKVYGPIDADGVKRMVEESLELIGYFLIFFGAVEELIIKPKPKESQPNEDRRE